MTWVQIKTVCRCLDKTVFIGYFQLKEMALKEMELVGPNLGISLLIETIFQQNMKQFQLIVDHNIKYGILKIQQCDLILNFVYLKFIICFY
jgi:hypothetical protein